MLTERSEQGQETASPALALSTVLFSAGLDSAVLAADEARHHAVLPVYVSAGLAWEEAERDYVERLLAAPVFERRVRDLVSLDLNMTDVYRPDHWAVRGRAPAYDTPDEDVYLPGRNLVLLTKAAVYAAQKGSRRVAIGTLAGNPFPDAAPEFFEALSRALSLGLGAPLTIVAPLDGLHKRDVIRLGVDLGVPLELTLSCMQPVSRQHCGLCSKCRERRDAFHDAGVADPTPYAAPSPR